MAMIVENTFDVIILGAGPGGISAAIWCADLGLKALLLEEEPEAGGQLLWIFNKINNYPGFLTTTAVELSSRFLEHLANTNVSVATSTLIKRIDLIGKAIETQDGQRFSTRAIIIATGVRRRTLGVPGENDFIGRGILSSGVRDQQQVSGKTVAVIGGGDAALENAILLSPLARKVVVVHRSEQFSARREFVEKAKEAANISFRLRSTVHSITGTDKVTGLSIIDSFTGETSEIALENVLIRIGVEPNTELFTDQLHLDDKGYIKVSVHCATNIDNVYAIGDVANSTSQTIATAVGMGATAVKSIERQLNHQS